MPAKKHFLKEVRSFSDSPLLHFPDDLEVADDAVGLAGFFLHDSPFCVNCEKNIVLLQKRAVVSGRAQPFLDLAQITRALLRGDDVFPDRSQQVHRREQRGLFVLRHPLVRAVVESADGNVIVQHVQHRVAVDVHDLLVGLVLPGIGRNLDLQAARHVDGAHIDRMDPQLVQLLRDGELFKGAVDAVTA